MQTQDLDRMERDIEAIFSQRASYQPQRYVMIEESELDCGVTCCCALGALAITLGFTTMSDHQFAHASALIQARYNVSSKELRALAIGFDGNGMYLNSLKSQEFIALGTKLREKWLS